MIGEIAKEGAVKIALLKNPVFHKCSKHIDIRYHSVREKVEDAQVMLEFCSTQDMLTDIIMKPTTVMQFEIVRNKLGIQAPYTIESSESVVKTTPRYVPICR